MLVQGTKEWLEFRRKRIGASDASPILGLNPWKSAKQLWEEKIGIKEEDEPTEKMKRGIELESKARDLFIDMTGLKVHPKVLVHKKYNWAIASLDGISDDGKNILEIKCGSEKLHEMAKSKAIPAYYNCQIQHQMAVAELEKAFYFSYNGEEGVIVEVERDQNFIEDMLGKEQIFYDCMVNFKQPEDDRYLEMGCQEWLEMAAEWKETKNQLDSFERKESELKNKLIELSCQSNARGGGIKLSKIIRKGNIDYSLVEELKGIDLERYRKKPMEFWKISDA